MTWILFSHPLGRIIDKGVVTVGTTVTIWVDPERNLVKREYNPDGVTVCGTKPRFNRESMRGLFNNELKWLRVLQNSRRIPHLVDYDEEQLTIVQESVGPDLYTRIQTGQPLPPNVLDQVIEIYDEYRQHGLFKGNGDTRNLGLRGEELVAFDFKWAKPRSISALSGELGSIHHFLRHIDPQLPALLRKTFSDFPEAC
jgi:hypothetical protein